HAADFLVRLLRVSRAAQTNLHAGVEGRWIGSFLHEPDRSSERTRAIQRALRTAQDLDPLQILQAQIDENRCVVDISCYGRNDGRCGRRKACGSLAVQAPYDQVRAVHTTEGPLVG